MDFAYQEVSAHHKNQDLHQHISSTALKIWTLNDSHVFLGEADGTIRMINRWSLEPVKRMHEETDEAELIDMQLNERVLAVKFRSGIVRIYDAATLEGIQSLDDTTAGYTSKEGLCLRADVLINQRLGTGSLPQLELIVRRWDLSSGRFQQTAMLQLGHFRHFSPLVHCDDKYVLVDYAVGGKRIIRVYDAATMQLVRTRQFLANDYIQAEYHHGLIVVQNCTDAGHRCVSAWDVDKDTVRLVTVHGDDFIHSFAITHQPYQIVINWSKNVMQLFLIEGEERCDHIILRSLCETLFMLVPRSYAINSRQFYFDGVQMYFVQQSMLEQDELHIVNCIS